ncbi:MAG: tripartite tricarboxylate transporter TctB family protein [Deltaproteobacteria bacterium]|nr:tripartite tricarboxylate transporter TctB family protein [Deltaproteobacteria bacterium]MBW2154039.1 tripartite tricarboxylate transporter TctB family protein [Deltaproteobacteria bacterium]
MNLSRIKNDIGLSLFLIGICVVMIWDSWDIPPGSFEPLGAGPVPRMIAYTVIAICLVIMLRAVLQWKRLKTSPGSKVSETTLPYRPRPKDAVIVLGLTTLYVGLMASRLVGFATITAVFLFITISLLMNFNRKSMLIAAVIALIMGFGCQYLFTKVFVVDLPTG